jgi:hypothetical protein
VGWVCYLNPFNAGIVWVLERGIKIGGRSTPSTTAGCSSSSRTGLLTVGYFA